MENFKSQALDTWREKLDYLQQQEAILADAGQKFALSKQITEAKSKIAELEAQAPLFEVKASDAIDATLVPLPAPEREQALKAIASSKVSRQLRLSRPSQSPDWRSCLKSSPTRTRYPKRCSN